MAEATRPGKVADRAELPGAAKAADLVAMALRTIEISQVLVASGTVGSIRVGNVQLGQATIDQLVIRDVATGIHSGRAFFDNVRSVIRVEVIVDWWFDLLFSSGKGRDTFISPLIPLEVGNLIVPSLQDISFSVPQVMVGAVQAQLTPIANFDLGDGRLDDIRVNATKLPAAGFDLGGLDLGPLTITDVGVPGTVTNSVTVGQFQPNAALALPAVEVTGVDIPAVQVPRVASNGPVNIFDLQPREPCPIGGLDLGIFGFSIAVKPYVHLQIGVLTLDDITLQASLGGLRLEGITSPVTLRDITLGNVQLQQVTVNQITI